MTPVASNTYRFSCKVVEVIFKDGKRVIKAITNPGSLIIEAHDDGKVQLGERIKITGTLKIEAVEPECPPEKK
ncbi:MAG: hypothetical protein ABFS10_00530 [Bacteroidota bacterium]